MAELLRPFELALIEQYKVFNPLEGRGGKATPRKGVWIRGHLQAVREDYPYGMWKRWTAFTQVAEKLEAKIEPGTYPAMRNYMHLLKRARLVVPTRRTPSMKSPLPEWMRQYYRVNPALLDSPLWLNPWQEIESWQREKARKFRPRGAPRPKRKKPR